MHSPIQSILTDMRDCCGCTACYSLCSSGAIEMKEDSEGFLYPRIDEKKCIGCLQCRRVCPILAADKRRQTMSTLY